MFHHILWDVHENLLEAQYIKNLGTELSLKAPKEFATSTALHFLKIVNFLPQGVSVKRSSLAVLEPSMLPTYIRPLLFPALLSMIHLQYRLLKHDLPLFFRRDLKYSFQ